MRRIRTTSANWRVRTTYESSTGILMLERPFPAPEDYEWALRINIDKYFVLVQNEEIQDGGAFSSGLCIATPWMCKTEDPCHSCPIRIKTDKPHCEALPFKFLEGIKSWSDQGDIYKEMYSFVSSLYRELYGEDYIPQIMEDSDAVIPQQKNKPSAGSPGGPSSVI